MIDPEEYDAWRQHPISRWFFQAMQTYANDQREDVVSKVWDNGSMSEIEIAMRRGQAFSANYFASASHEEIAKYHEDKE